MASLVLLYYPGTGSSWLMGMLAAAPGVWVPGYEPLEQWHWDAPETAKLAWLRTALAGPPAGDAARGEWVTELRASPQVKTDPPPGAATVGFKMTEDAVRDRRALLDTFGTSGARVLFLTREHRIKHALSLYRSYEERKNQFQFAGVMPASKVDLGLFDQWLERAVGWHERTEELRRRCVAALGAEAVAVIPYERFAADDGKRAVLRDACEFGGLEAGPVLVALEETLVGGEPFGPRGHYGKSTADDLAAAVVNFRQLRGHYRGTEWEHYFA